jgi:o-succinylbenzoate---CoA ligase
VRPPTRRRLVPVDARSDVGTGLAPATLTALAAALEGTGPAVAPVPPGPEGDRIRAVLQVDLPLEHDGIAAVLPTSGSTGEPKAVLLPAAALRHSATATAGRLGGPGQWLLALPVHRVAGLQVLVRSLLAATTPVQVDGPFTPSAFCAATARLDTQRRYTALVPTQLVRLLDAGPEVVAALASYDCVLVGGGASGPDLLERATASGVRVVTTYGMTETCGGCVYAGVALDGVRVAVERADGDADDVHGGRGVDAGSGPVGRVRIAGPVLFAGYRLRPDLTAAALVDGWHRTGDLGRFDATGRLQVVGRVDDVVVSGGVNVALPAVERALVSLAGVAEGAAVGVPDPEWGMRVVAYVVLRPGATPPTLGDVRDHVAETCPRTWAPRELVVVEALPTLPSGKLDRAALAARTP